MTGEAAPTQEDPAHGGDSAIAAATRMATATGGINPARPVYGMIIVLAAALGADEASAGARQSLAIVALAFAAIVLAEAYADLIGTAIRERRRLGRADLVPIGVGIAGAAVGAVPAAAFLLLALLGAMSVDLALDLTIWTLVGMLFGVGLVAARAAGTRLLASVGLGAVLLVVALALVGLKVVIH